MSLSIVQVDGDKGVSINESRVQDKSERRATSASDDKEKCDSEREGDVVGEMGNVKEKGGKSRNTTPL